MKLSVRIAVINPFATSKGHAKAYTNILVESLLTALVGRESEVDLYVPDAFELDLEDGGLQSGRLQIICVGKGRDRSKKNGTGIFSSIKFAVSLLYGCNRFFLAASEQICFRQYDAIYIIGGETLTNLAWLRWLTRGAEKNIVGVLNIHNSDYGKNLYGDFVGKRIYKMISRWMIPILVSKRITLFTHGPKMKAQLEAQLRIESARVDWFRIPIAKKFIGSRGDTRAIGKGGVKRILFYGVIRQDKGLDLLINALVRLREEAWELDVSGSPAQMGEKSVLRLLEPIIERCRLTLRYLSDEELNSCISQADFVVLPYRKSFQAQSVAMIDAIARAKPVVVPDCSEAAEEVERLGLGMTFEAESVASLSATLLQMLRWDQNGFEIGRSEYLGQSSYETAGQRLLGAVVSL